jgi:GNAT superfamily N-acetyltransferase
MSGAPEEIVVRPAREADLDTIGAIQEAAILALAACAYAPDQLAAWARVGIETRHGLLGQGSFFVAEIRGQTVGVAGWSADGGDRSGAWIRYVFVRPDAVRKGIGRRLMAAVEVSARGAGRSVFHVWSSLNATAFYQALGYRRRRAIRVPLGRGLEMSGMHMVKQGAPISNEQLRGMLPKPERPATIEEMDEAIAQEAIERYLRSTSKP